MPNEVARVEKIGTTLRKFVRRGARSHISNLLDKTRPEDVALVMRGLTPEHQLVVFRILITEYIESAGAVITEVEPQVRVAIIESLTAEPEVTDVIPLLSTFKADLDGQTVYLVFHGGCPDGCLAAYIMRHEIHANYKPARLILCPTSHDTKNADMLEDGCTAIFVDVGPRLADIEKLMACRFVIVLDHHASQQSILTTTQ